MYKRRKQKSRKKRRENERKYKKGACTKIILKTTTKMHYVGHFLC